MLTTLFFHNMPGVRVDRVWCAGATLHLAAGATRRAAQCPLCRHRSRRLHSHSHYDRTLADLPWAGDRVTIPLRVRRFVCRVRHCPRRIFAERLPALAFTREDTADKRQGSPHAQEVIVGCAESHADRRPDLDVTLYGGGPRCGVSRRHARLARVGSGFVVIDIGSAQGTCVNGPRTLRHHPVPLADGDRLAFGALDTVVSIT